MLWTLGSELWALDSGPWALSCGFWALVSGMSIPEIADVKDIFEVMAKKVCLRAFRILRSREGVRAIFFSTLVGRRDEDESLRAERGAQAAHNGPTVAAHLAGTKWRGQTRPAMR